MNWVRDGEDSARRSGWEKGYDAAIADATALLERGGLLAVAAITRSMLRDLSKEVALLDSKKHPANFPRAHCGFESVPSDIFLAADNMTLEEVERMMPDIRAVASSTIQLLEASERCAAFFRSGLEGLRKVAGAEAGMDQLVSDLDDAIRSTRERAGRTA